MSKSPINLVADIGGTNIRLGLVNNDGSTGEIKTYQCDRFNSLADVICEYLALQDCFTFTSGAVPRVSLSTRAPKAAGLILTHSVLVTVVSTVRTLVNI